MSVNGYYNDYKQTTQRWKYKIRSFPIISKILIFTTTALCQRRYT